MTPNVCQTCGARKKSFISRAEAKQAARTGRGYRLRVYRCGPYFHLTSFPADRTAAIRAGLREAS